MAGLWRGASGLWGGFSGLWRGVSSLWGGASGLVAGGGAPVVPPEVQSPPFIVAGPVVVGTALTCNPGVWAPTQDYFAFQWFKDGSTQIAGATAITYTPVAGDVGSILAVEVKAYKGGVYGTEYTTVPVGPVVAATGFSATFNTTNLVYDEDDRLVYRTDDITRRAVRGKTGHTSGKWYVELMPLVTRLRFAGVVDSHYNTVGAGTPPGVGRVGVLGNELVAYPAVAIPLGQFAAPGTVVRIAWDADADLLWLKLDNDDWNDNPLADPVTGIGGLSTAGLDGPGYVGATLRPVTGASVRYRLPGDLGYSLPSGYEEWST